MPDFLDMGTIAEGDIYEQSGNSTQDGAAVATNVALNGAGATDLGMSTGTPSTGGVVGFFVSLIIILIALRWFAMKAGDGDDYSFSFQPTFYNIMTATLAVIPGFILLKFLATKLPPNSAMGKILLSL